MNNKLCIALIVMSLMLIGLAAADTQVSNNLITPLSGSAQGGATTFSFAGISGQPIASTWRWGVVDTVNYNVPTTLGDACNVGEYIVAYQCPAGTSTFSSSCSKMFTEDWLRSSTYDLLPYAQWKDVQWFKDMFYKYNMPVTYYQCLRAKQDVQVKANGAFTSINYPSSALTSSSITVTGTFAVTQTGPFVLEANIDPNSKTTFAVVIKSSASPCDGSAYYSGSRVNGVAGQSYPFELTMKTPPDPGRYTLNIYTYTDCAKNGGQEIQTISRSIDIKGATNCDIAYAAKQSFLQNAWQTIVNYYDPTKIFSGCTYESIRQYCGTKDSDADGVPDNCDYCPQDKGSATNAYVGCHPCFGKDPSTTDGANCWLQYASTYPTPAAVKAILNPIVGTSQSCDDSGLNLITNNVYKDGTKTEKSIKSCPPNICTTIDDKSAACTDATMTVCIDNTKLCQGAAGWTGKNWMCTDVDKIKTCTQGCKNTITSTSAVGVCGEDITNTAATAAATSTTKTKTGTYTECLEGNVAKYQKYSDGTSVVINNDLFDCAGNGCQDGACNPGTTCNGGQSSCPDTQNPAIVATGNTCSVDSDCPSGQKCDNTKQCIDMSLPVACKTNADCTDTTKPICSSDIGVCKAKPECTVDADCGAGKQCAGEKCIDGLVETNSSTGNDLGTCTVDQTETCDNGATIITAKCVNGKLEAGDNKCSQETTFWQNLFGTPAEKTSSTGSTRVPTGASGISALTAGGTGGTNWLLIGGVAVVLIIGFVFLKKTGPKGHKKKKR